MSLQCFIPDDHPWPSAAFVRAIVSGMAIPPWRRPGVVRVEDDSKSGEAGGEETKREAVKGATPEEVVHTLRARHTRRRREQVSGRHNKRHVDVVRHVEFRCSFDPAAR